ncbi:DUF5666 domain-containing protein [Arsukibacterium perlucidum]|uniref:DUF5666 domain-containing protein n=1 Tax=Arsukibacterium perlucidum TaxID=368811 RepID=UPI000366B3C3|nr:DUF5666 domain-containing protein [Arsukibacterium perlucidum]
MSIKRSLLSLSVASLLAACGGSDSSESTPPIAVTPAPPVSTNVTTTGVITGFGSVIVNGVKYETNGSAISTDDSPAATESDLAVGMVVNIVGTLDDDGQTGRANVIRYNAEVEGVVNRIDLANQQLRVLGQWISYDDLTEFDDVSLTDLRVGDVVEVSGYRVANGSFYATRIELEEMDKDLKVRGIVSELNAAAQTFMLGELTVNYAGAELDDFGSTALANDLMVKVEGEGGSYDVISNILLAREIELQGDAVDANDGDVLKLEGAISHYLTDESFELAERTIFLDDDTDFRFGSAQDLADGVRIKIKAEYEDGRWEAEDIVFIRDAITKLSGEVSSVDLTASTLTVSGETFLVTAQTQFEDESDSKVRVFDLSALTINDFVKVLGFTNDDAVLVALKVERDNDDKNEIELKGKPSEVGSDFLLIFGNTITVDADTEFDDNDRGITQQEFFSRINTDTLIEVEAVRSGDVLVAREMKIERDDDEDDIGKVEFKGLITAVLENGIQVDGTAVLFDANTELEIDDVELSIDAFLAAVIVGDQAEVEGFYNENNQIIAEEVEVERDDD